MSRHAHGQGNIGVAVRTLDHLDIWALNGPSKVDELTPASIANMLHAV
ncbi:MULTISPECIES: hypothetical protein [unclassified Corynebacterium]|nr:MULTISPECIES: hypothetical protein [unclassified Corynebacterium]MCS4490629.1 hypothetical protein [Corynebacterium sp. ES2775-CONJ]MCS4492430.1 hypothetical protein [Corynebacterium sp. ES2715-CONJ3]MCS4532606.1 hypothetical protein [Corynebacterium sp. ES2730-CONJ]